MRAAFSVGDIIRHRLFRYRGVIVDVDAEFSLTDEWYERMAKSKPPRNKPWYHVLVDGANHSTYVAQQNLEHDDLDSDVVHPHIDKHFAERNGNRYRSLQRIN